MAMKIPFRDLKQNKFSLEFEPDTLISGVKQKLAEEKGWDAKTLKLIYSGKILKDEDTVASYKIKETDFVVCMVMKPKTAPAQSTAVASSSKPPSTPAQPATSTPSAPVAAAPAAARAVAPSTPTPAARTTEAAAATATSPSSQTFNDPSALTIGAERTAAIQQLMAMGFEQSQAEAAMRAAFYNPDRAVEYLLNGIPENIQQEQAAAQAPAAPAGQAAPAQPAGGAGDGGDDGNVNLFDLAAAHQGGGGRGGAAATAASGQGQGFGNLDFLRNNAQFQQFRQVVQQQPQMLEPILQQLGQGNPQLAQLIANNPGQFLNLLSEDVDDDAPLPPGAQTIAVTEEERDAIERLCRLGFPRDQAIQAYFACDKNEELAANFLFDQPEEDDPPPQ